MGWSVGAWVVGLALAAGPAELDAVDEVSEVVDVVGEAAMLRARLDRSLRSLGFRRPRARSDGVVYHHRRTFEPSLRLYDDGRFHWKRGPARIGLPGQGPWGSGGARMCGGVAVAPRETEIWVGPMQTTTVTNTLDMGCLHLDGQLLGARLYHGKVGRRMEQVGGLISEWTAAVADEAQQHRVAVALPAELRARWEQAGGGEAGADALIAHGCTRTETPEGDAVRRAIGELLTELDGSGVERLAGGWRPACAGR
jgi:hypothetical protein